MIHVNTIVFISKLSCVDDWADGSSRASPDTDQPMNDTGGGAAAAQGSNSQEEEDEEDEIIVKPRPKRLPSECEKVKEHLNIVFIGHVGEYLGCNT